MFSLMETTDDGILFHCGGGKDRTGIFAALVLSLFGCDKQTIFDDYLKSNESVKNHLMPKLLQSDYPQPVKDTFMYVRFILNYWNLHLKPYYKSMIH